MPRPHFCKNDIRLIMLSFTQLIKFNSRLNRRDFFIYSILIVLIYILIAYFVLSDQSFDFDRISRLIVGSVCELLVYTGVFFIAVARLKDMDASKFWAIIFFVSWFFGLKNMFLFDYYFNNSQGISSLVTYLSFFVSGITFIFFVFLLAKRGKGN